MTDTRQTSRDAVRPTPVRPLFTAALSQPASVETIIERARAAARASSCADPSARDPHLMRKLHELDRR